MLINSVFVSSFNNIDLLTSAKLCRICYSKITDFNITNKKLYNIYTNYTLFNNVFIFNNHTKIDVCFKGTSNFNDMIYNLQVCPSSFKNKNIRIHTGYLYKYLEIKKNLINKLNIIINNNNINQITFAGHSSGGAIANIAIFDLYNYYNNINNIKLNCVSFGMPKFSNEYFNNEFNNNNIYSLRVMNNNDIIQYLTVPIYYKHNHKNNLILHNKLDYIYNNPIYLFKHNHGMTTYIKNIHNYNYL